MKNTSEKIDTKIPIDKFSDSRCLRGEQHEFIKALKARYDKEGIEISWPVRKVYYGK